MKKNIYDLTIEEFVRLLCGVPKIYEFDLTSIGKGLSFEQSIIKGDYWTLHNFFNQQLLEDEPIRSFAQGVLKELSNWFNYSLEYCITDIYDYLDYKTKGFEAERCKTVLFDMDYYLFIIKEEIEADGEEYKGQFTDYYAAISILKNKIGSMDINTESVKENETNEKPNPNVDWYKRQTDSPPKNKKSNNDFKSIMVDDDEGHKLNRLKDLIGGKKGKNVVLILIAAMKKGWLMAKPTFRQVKEEFGDIGAEQGYNKYFNVNFTNLEIETAIKALE